MRIKLVSDLHLEFSDIKIENDANYDVLILGGDIMIAQDLHDHPTVTEYREGLGSRQLLALRYRHFLASVSSAFPHVVYIAGNHELYHGKWKGGIETLRKECALFNNIYFLDCDTKVIDGVVFVGATLWTDMNRRDPITVHSMKGIMNDYRVIRNDTKGYTPLTPTDTVHRHTETLEYFSQVLKENADKPCVVVGHHLPSSLGTHPKYKDEYITNGAYRSELGNFILDHPQIVLWTCGHTHTPHRYYIGSTLVACNPRGYETSDYVENKDWNPNRCIDLSALPSVEAVEADWSWSNVQ